MQAIQVIEQNSETTLSIEEVPTPQPADNELLVKIHATALNRADLLQRAGKYPPPEGASEILGLEMAGIVEKVGPGVSRWEPGDRVFALLPGGGYAEYCTVHEDMAMPVPGSLSFKEAAAIPETFLTAYQALVWLGKLAEGETVLIHAGGSGVGTSAIQLANKLCHARIITTAGKQHKLEAARQLGAEFAYNYKTQRFADEITDTIGPNSVDLIIDFIGKPYWHQNMEVLATDGRLVYLSFLGGHRVEEMSLIPILKKRLSIMGSTLRSRSLDYKIDLTSDFADRTLKLFENDMLRPVIDSSFNWAKAEQAHQRMQENKNTGKIVLTGM
jgi:putative PIG3 family NAD(P)H quinone oxidoreductase